MDCTIKFKGHNNPDKIKRDGRPLKDGTREVSKAIIDSAFWYKEVFNHIKTCRKCDPEEILKIYFSRRMAVRFEFQTSPLLVALALRYEKFGKLKNRPISKDLVDDFIVKSNPFLVGKHENRLSFERLKDFIHLSKNREPGIRFNPASKKQKTLAYIFDIHGIDFFKMMDEEQFQKMETLIEVHSF